MKDQILHYAGYTIKITYDEYLEEYDYIVSDETGKKIFERYKFEDENDAFASACMQINDET